MDPYARHRLVNSPGRIFDHSTIHGKVHSFLYRMPWNLILPLSALAFIIFVSVLSIKSGLEQAELYKRNGTTPSVSSTFLTTVKPADFEMTETVTMPTV